MDEKKEEKKDEQKQEKQEVKQEMYCPPPNLPVMQAVDELTFDFNDGLRVNIPKKTKGKYRIVFADMNSGLVVYSSNVEAGSYVASVKKYCIDWKLMIYDQNNLQKPVFEHEMNLEGRNVLFPIPEGAMGDTIAWFSYIVKFTEKRKCNSYVVMMPWMRTIFEPQYPDIHWITKEQAKDFKPYATYRVGLYFCEESQDYQPMDFRKTGLHHTVGYMLGFGPKELGDFPPKVDLSHERIIKEKYVVIATKASSACKFWNNRSGWREVIAHLKEKGYRVLCIDKDHEVGVNECWYEMPYGAEDFTGNRPLQERIDIIKDADLFIGMSSGLAWLAWCCLPPEKIIMINTFTEAWNEFDCRHIQNLHVCHGCWNDCRYSFEHKNFLYCKHEDDRFACSKYISSEMVISEVDEALGL